MNNKHIVNQKHTVNQIVSSHRGAVGDRTGTGCRVRVHRAGRLLSVPAIAFAAAPFAPSPAAGAQGVPLACGTVVTTNVRLAADLVDCPGSGLVVGAPGITIDLAGHTIDGTGSGAGIDNGAGHDNVRIVRGTVQEFLFGVHLFDSAGSRIDRIVAVANADGLKIERVQGLDVSRVTASDNWASGVEITFSEAVTIRNSSAAGNGLWGIVDRYSYGSHFVRNTLTGNAADGLTVDRVAGAVVERNRAEGNHSDGIAVGGTEDAKIVRNDAIGNAGNGVTVDRAGNTVTRNTAIDNQGYGIAAVDGTVDGGRNRASGNLAGDCTGVTCR